jgi:hypothetical protein
MPTFNRPAIIGAFALLVCFASRPLFLCAASPPSNIPGNSYEIQQLAPGVYAAVRHVGAGTADGNTMFIINDSDVIVVDTGA